MSKWRKTSHPIRYSNGLKLAEIALYHAVIEGAVVGEGIDACRAGWERMTRENVPREPDVSCWIQEISRF